MGGKEELLPMKLRLIFPSVVAVVVAVGIAFASGAGATPSHNDHFSGDGTRAPSCDGCPTPSFSIDAVSSPTGANPSGTMSVNLPGEASFSGHVVCLTVEGNQGTAVAQMDTASGLDAAPGGYFLVTAWDNGKPVKGVSPDQMGLIDWGTSVSDAFGPYTVAQVCADPSLVIGTATFGLLSGNVNVADAD
jgi:hypothetical protein